MSYFCTACGQPWDPSHVCQEMLDIIFKDINLAKIRGEKRIVFDRGRFAEKTPDKSPSVAELDHRRRERPWRPE